jgi:hypothetical protein
LTSFLQGLKKPAIGSYRDFSKMKKSKSRPKSQPKSRPRRTGKPTGRPIKEVPAGRTVQLGVLVAAGTKAVIVEAAKISGKSLSREAETLIEPARSPTTASSRRWD